MHPLMVYMNPYIASANTTSNAVANPQLLFFENFPGMGGNAFHALSLNTLSIHAVNIPLSISFNKVINLISVGSLGGTTSRTVSNFFGLYSLNGGTLSLANSASGSLQLTNNGISWISLVTSATQNISPGAWYFALFVNRSGAGGGFNFGNSSINPGNGIPGQFRMGRMTVSTAAMPASIATSDLDITGSDAVRQPYIIITA